MFNKHFLLLFIILIVFILIPTSFALENSSLTENMSIEEDSIVLTEYSNEIHVDINGDDNNKGGMDDPLATINKAINVSSNNSKIIVHEGIYKENNLNITKSLEICGNGDVVIDAENISRIFTINTGTKDKVILSGITFTNGKAYQGGAIYVRNAETTINNSKFINNTALTEGGAIYWNSDYGTLINTLVEGNTARDGAGVSWGGINSTFTGGDYGQIINCTFNNNHLVQDEDACVGLSIYSNRNKVINSSFINHNVNFNSSFEVLYINGDYSTVSGCLFENNTMTLTGALGFDGNYAEAYNNIFKNNTLSYNNSFGGAIGIQSETITVSNNTFISNGGENAVGGAIFINTVETFQFNFITVKDNVFINNKGFYGGAIYATSNSNFLTLLIENNTFNGDKARNGAAIYLIDIYDPVIITNNSYNNLISDYGPGIYSYSCTLDISNNLIGNYSSLDGSAIYSYGDIYSNLKLIFDNVTGALNKDVILTAVLLDDSGNLISTNSIDFEVDGKIVKGTKGINCIKSSFDTIGIKEISGSCKEGNVSVVNGILTILNTINLSTDNITVYGNKADLQVKLTNDSGKPVFNCEVIVNINGNDVLLISNELGIAQTSIYLDYGSYNFTAQFIDDIYYQSVNSSFTVTVLPGIESDDLIRSYSSGLDFKAKLYNKNGSPLNNTKVVFNVDGKNYEVKTDANGIAILNLKLKEGNYNIIVTNPVTSETTNNNLKIVKRLAGNKNVNLYFGASAYYQLRVYGDDGKVVGAGQVVKVTFNGKTYNSKTNSKGYIKFKISGKPKTYKITALYKGVKVSNKVVIKKVLTAKNISKKKSKTIKFSAKLVNTKGKVVKGKKITFKFKGKTYKAKTNKKGIATISLKNLKVGKYTITTKYGKSTIKNTIKIRR